MPINPVTKREQVYPGADSIEEFRILGYTEHSDFRV